MSSYTVDNPLLMSALESLFESLSPQDKQSFLSRSSASSSPSSEPTSTQQLEAMPAGNDSHVDSPSSAETASANLTAARRRRQVLNERKQKKKPLNAFMAYRSYYSPILSGLTQKAKSGMVRQMWAEEPAKNLFALIGQAYSELRDGNVDAGLDKDFLKKFMPAMAGILPLIPADQYLDTMGWVRRTTPDGEVRLERNANVRPRTSASMGTNLSVANLVDHCYKSGILTRSSNTMASRGRNVGGAMSFAAPPTMSPALRLQLWPAVEIPAINGQAIGLTATPVVTPAATTVTPSAPFDFNDLSTNYGPTIAQVTEDQQQAFDQMPIPVHFHPAMHPPVLGFDPNMVQDEFDPYNVDVSQYLNEYFGSET